MDAGKWEGIGEATGDMGGGLQGLNWGSWLGKEGRGGVGYDGGGGRGEKATVWGTMKAGRGGVA